MHTHKKVTDSICPLAQCITFSSWGNIFDSHPCQGVNINVYVYINVSLKNIRGVKSREYFNIVEILFRAGK